MANQLRYQGRFIKKTVLSTKLKRKNILKEKQAKWKHNLQLANTDVHKTYPCEGNRIVNLQELSDNLWCKNCQKDLSLRNIISEKQTGLHSVLKIQCSSCSLIINVSTGKQHTINEKAKEILNVNTHNDVTSNAVLGALHAGIDYAQLNKIFSCLDLPNISTRMYKKYEQEVGQVIEETAKQSCKDSAIEERQLVLEKIDELHQLLPEEIKHEFGDQVLAFKESLESHAENNNTPTLDKILSKIINIIVSFDMGWSKRGNGRSYDSLNGYGAIIGFLSGKILDYSTRNRKCQKCDVGNSREDHDCRKNFQGSAKSMEADVGLELINHSKILKDVGLKVKVYVGDEDSTTMAAINRDNFKNGSKNKIYKLADMNHVKKNLSKKLYSMQSQFKQLKKKGLIAHIKKCFSYALSQCKQNSPKLASALRFIPDHLYNLHENCGDWCKRKTGISPQKFVITNENLHLELKKLFLMYADNAEKYSIPASSNPNESLNSIIAHQLPKNKSYSKSNSADFRVATAVLLKNEGSAYIPIVKKKMGLSVSRNTTSFCLKVDKVKRLKYLKSKTVQAKTRRLQLKVKRENLRKNLENSEGITYMSNISFETNNVNTDVPIIDESTPLLLSQCDIVYFDLETSGRKKTDDILQIAAKVKENIFSVYITPTQSIAKEATDVNGLEHMSGQLYLRGEKLITISMLEALQAFHAFLTKSCNKGCILVAHNASFDISFLLREIKRYSLVAKFKNVIYGFCDSLKVLKKKLPDRKGKGMMTLSMLTQEYLPQESFSENFHEALFDVNVLEQLVEKLLKTDDLFKYVILFSSEINHSIDKERISFKIKTFSNMKGILSDYMIKKIATVVSYEDLLASYKNFGENYVTSLLSELHNNKPKVTNNKPILNKIIIYLKSVCDYNL